MGTFQSETGLFLETPRRVDTDWDALSLVLPLCQGLDILKITNGPREKLQKVSTSYN